MSAQALSVPSRGALCIMHRLALALLLAVTFACCLPAVDAPFVYDEHAGIEDNRVVHPGARYAEALAFRYSPDQTRPLFFASLLFDANLWGPSPRGMRLTSFALHLICGVLLYFLLKRPPAGVPPAALAGCALFLLHPLQSESVLYIWGRSEILSTVFGLGALLCALRAEDGPGGDGRAVSPVPRFYGWWGGALICTALGLAAKEETVALPAVFFLWWTLAERRPAKPGLTRALALGIPVALFLGLRAVALGRVGRQVYVRSVADNILGQGVATLKMIRLFFMPVGQTIDHPTGVPGTAAGLLAVGACAALVAWAARVALKDLRLRSSAPRGAARGTVEPAPVGPVAAAMGSPSATRFACGILIAATASILYWLVPLPDLVCERRAYFPLAGMALSLAALLEGVRRSRAWLIFAILVLLLAPAMVLRARVWADPARLWGEAARLAPRKARPLINLGVVAAEKGDRDGALDLFSRAISIEPLNAEALFNRGKLHLDAGELPSAIADLSTAVSSNPGFVRARINLALAEIDAHDLPAAEAELRTALLIEPRNPRSLTNLAEVLRATGRHTDAVALYREALDADPTYAHAAVRLGVTLENIGDPQGALAAYREYLRRGAASAASRKAVEEKIRKLESAASAP